MLLLIILAFFPGAFVCFLFYKRDAQGRIPPKSLVIAFLCGVVSTIPAMLVEYATLPFRYASIGGALLSAFILTALTEECSRFLAIRLYAFRQKDFKAPIDGIIYAVMVSMGFATVENLFYVFEKGVSAGMIRSYTAMPAHATFGIMMGYYLGLSRFDDDNRIILYAKGIGLATLMHGFYDFFVFLERDESLGRLVTSDSMDILCFTGALVTLTISVFISARLIRLHRKNLKTFKPQPTSLRIRNASMDDVDVIRSLSLQTWPQTYAHILTPEQITYMMNLMYSREALLEQMQKGHHFILLFKYEEPVGFAAYSEIEDRIFKLHKIYLKREQQGYGGGRRMIDYIISMARKSNAKILQLNVNRNNIARTFYERLGFSITRSEDIDIGDGFFMNDYVMEKKL
ncbi:MAG: GNAT family N-acetyltransferase [Flavisolibacter sp.]